MPFIGNQPALSYTSFAKQDFTTSVTTSYTLDNPVANANELALFINFVRQEPTTAYSASGTSLTLTSATSATDDMYCVFLGKAVQTVNPPNASVGTNQLVDGAVTSAKLASGAVANTPAFEAYLSANQSFTDNTETKVQFNTEVFDTDGTYDNSTNYRFTPTTAGKYFVYAQVVTDVTDLTNKLYTAKIAIYKNGSTYKEQDNMPDFSGSSGWDILVQDIFATVVMNGSSDYLEIYAKANGDQNGNFRGNATRANTNFGAYKIIE
jgi:hypothetical protein